jgi:transglutaminase-like putative cysteine protease
MNERRRLHAVAYPRFSHGPLKPVAGLQAYLHLPVGYNPRTLAWAAALRSDPRLAGADASTLAQAVFRHIRTQPYVYTLAPDTYGDAQGRHAIDEFWLDRREGFCEHYAAAFAVVMRAMGVPARIVTGYQGAELNPVDGYYLVRNSYAHAWAEYWQGGRGWVRADPTAAVAPDRIVRNLNLRPAPGFMQAAFEGVDPDLWRALRERWQALNTGWNQWVLNYSRGQQMNLLRRLGFQTPSWQDLYFLLLALVVLASSAGAAWAWWDRRRQDPWLRTWHSMRRALARNGLESASHLAPRTLADRTLARWGEAGRGVAQVLHQMEAMRYAPRQCAPTAGTSASRGAAVRRTTLTRLSLRALARRLERALSELPDA